MNTITDMCCGCTACYNVCPVEAISMSKNDGFIRAEVNSTKCIDCQNCILVCPQNTTIDVHPIKAYLCESKDRKNYMESSSGGLFYVLANEIISREGVVFGVEIDDNLKVIHSFATEKDQLGKYRLSKYVQSDIGESFNQARKFLDKGREVLFIGTPCQIAGLTSYLGKKYEKLYTIDFLCHGVPSSSIFSQEIAWLEQKYKSPICNITFRQKTKDGKPQYAMSFSLTSGKRISLNCSLDPYLNAFINSNSLNECCYSCKYANFQKASCLTLSDSFNGPENEKDYHSILIINNTIGETLFKSIQDKIDYSVIDLDIIKKYKSNLETPAIASNNQLRNLLKNQDNYLKYANDFCKTKTYKKHKIYNLVPICIKNIIKKLSKRK